ncbi:MAG: MASE1 domain-containing protein [bacterium]|nr:MASE1 domain-containing protein [bacterium]
MSKIKESLWVFLLYLGTAELSISLSSLQSDTGIVWPAAGIAFGAMLYYGTQVTPAIFLASLLSNWHYLSGFSSASLELLARDLVISTGNILSPYLGLMALKSWPRFDARLRRYPDILAFGFLGAVPAAATAALFGAIAVRLGGSQGPGSFFLDWWLWGVSDWVGILLAGPAFTLWLSVDPLYIGFQRKTEKTVITLAILGIGWFVFGPHDPFFAPLAQPYYLLLPLLWGAIRFSPRAVVSWNLLAFLIVWLSTSYGFGHFSSGHHSQPLSTAQAFIGLMSLTSLLFCASVQELKQLYRRLREANERLEERVAQRTAELTEANQHKNLLFSILSHDLRGPINNFAQITDMVADEEDLDSTSGQEAIELVRQGSHSVKALVDNLFDWASLSFADQNKAPEPRPIGIVIKQCLAQLELLLKEKQIQVTLDLGNPEALVDRHGLLVVLRNLISNGIKFSFPGGNLNLKAQATPERVMFSLSDQGVGIETAQLERMRLAKPQPSAYGTAGEKGAGLGLVLITELLKAQGSRLQIDSTLGQGSCFSFDLPRLG